MEYGTWAGIPNLFEGAFQTFLPRCCGHVLCPGFDDEEYCECGEEDCEIHATGQCGCEAAQSESCCGKDSEDEVVCPGFDDDDFCDCETDCIEKPEQCACAEAQACCSD